jgi:NAD(P)-dependent dehydrogenase (short-subunit alcohol dehydrogenase family)
VTRLESGDTSRAIGGMVPPMDLSGKTVVITGATSGLGQAAAIDFAKGGARVFIVGRDAERAKQTQAQAGGNSEVLIGDVSTRAGVKTVAQSILAKTQKIDVLLNNAGGQFKTLTKTADGVETTFALNTLGAFLLERELHAAIVAAKGRVVNVVTGFLNSFPVNPDDLVDPKKFASMGAYARSKHASVMMSVEQAKRFESQGVKVEAVHPGIIMGTRFGGGQPKIAQLIGGPIMRGIGLACTLEEAVRRFRVACFGDLPTGSYVVKGEVAPLPTQVNDEGVRKNVYALLEKLAA